MNLTQTSAAPISSSALSYLLGYAGLLPFFALAFLHLSSSTLSIAGLGKADALSLFGVYSLAIASFLCGSLWQQHHSALVLVSSNSILLIAVAMLAWRPLYWLPVLALLYLAILLVERYGLPQQSKAYSRLRLQLSSIVITLHLVLFLF
ncbi:DUF3429 domain-containing protein [Oceanicoccus sagamiensis]|uniref:DUF3429 domain-containing protein n=1 Tax=Oceanicoccus sagamiensis TaxID=716816 RepID=A0A1X9NAV3_9GAMM|nr:DUF3429 family protein [Oceanicoccus sagamiensis]ARN72669.1 hypothetical protein BST96_00185 [Oceanicoccus sagamiensis]